MARHSPPPDAAATPGTCGRRPPSSLPAAAGRSATLKPARQPHQRLGLDLPVGARQHVRQLDQRQVVAIHRLHRVDKQRHVELPRLAQALQVGVVHGDVTHEPRVVVRLEVLQNGQHVHLVHAALALCASHTRTALTLVLLRVLEEGVDLGLDVCRERTDAVYALALVLTPAAMTHHDVHHVVQRRRLHFRQQREDGRVGEGRVRREAGKLGLRPLRVREGRGFNGLEEGAKLLGRGDGVVRIGEDGCR